MKLAVICHEHPPLGGGGGNAAAQMSRQLARLGHNVVFFTSHLPGLPVEETVNGYRIVRIDIKRSSPSGCSLIELIRFYFRGRAILPRYFDAQRPEMMLAYFSLPGGLLALDMRQRLNIPYFVYLRGGDVPGFLSRELGWHQFAVKPLIRRIWHNAARILANSEYLALLAKKTTDRTVDVVPNGYYTEDFRPDASRRPAGHVSLLFSGRLVPQKGVGTLLESLSRLSKKDFRLEIVGSGPLSGELQAQARRLGIADRVSFRGWVSRDRILPFYQAAHALILPSFDEGMPNVVNEAVACGAAIIGTSVGGIPEVVQDGYNGRIVPPGNPETLARVLDELLSHPQELERMGKNSAELARSRTWEHSAAILQKLLETGERH